MYDDIPEASRQPATEPSRTNTSQAVYSRRFDSRVGLLVGGGLLGVLAIALVLWSMQSPTAQQTTAQTVPQVPTQGTTSPDPASSPSTSASISPTIDIVAVSSSASSSPPDALLGHLAYSEAPAIELVPITNDGQIKLRQAAADSYRKMAAAAAADGVQFFVISGFRSIADQNTLFFRVKEERNQSPLKRAEVSAPPGHSEHHTGYAMDIGDAAQPDTNLSQSFDQTVAFQWLQNHAAQYSFEMSFTKGNSQGVSYEPWHWRFVGDQNSLETFYRAQHLKPETP